MEKLTDNRYRATYLISSRRNREDERDVIFYSNMILDDDDTITLDGISWDVEMVLYDPDRKIDRRWLYYENSRNSNCYT